MGPKQRSAHCQYAVVNRYGRCIAGCHYNWDSQFEHDCTGKDRVDDEARIKQEIEDRKAGLI